MKRAKLIKELSRHAKNVKVEFQVAQRRGKGSHYLVTIGGRRTIIKNGELSDQYVDLILKQLGIAKDAIRR